MRNFRTDIRISTPRLWSAARWAVRGALGLAAALGFWLAGLQLTGNIHAVEAGVLYRSAQLDQAALSDVIEDNHIKSVLNLRGFNPDSVWYREEFAVSRALGVAHFDFPLSANSVVDPGTMARLGKLLRDAPKPLLIHCQSGADRTGLAAALYEFAITAQAPEEAEEQLSLRFGHFPWLWSRTDAMDKSFEIFVRQSPPRSNAGSDKG